MVKMFRFTPEFKVLCALVSGDSSFSELKRKTGLSGRWLSKTLVELMKDGFVWKRESLYQLASIESIRDIVRGELTELNKSVSVLLPSVHMREKAICAANHIGMDKNVIGIVLFGSVAKGTGSLESDIDLLLICDEKSDMTDLIYNAMVNVEAPIEALTMTFRQFLINLLDEPTIVFGIIEGYEVLYDSVDMMKGLLEWKEADIKRRWVYNEEEGIWLEKRLQPYLKQHMTSY